MSPWLLAAGVLAIVVVFHDAFVTTVSPISTGGPITQRLAIGIWRLLRRLARSPRSSLLAAAGPAIVFIMLLVWLVGLWAGWTLVFSADPGAVVHAETGTEADAWARAYFAGYTVYTLGLGDFAPAGSAWQVLTAAATITGFVLLTMSVSYLIPVVMAVSERRQHGIWLHGLGDSAQQILLTAWDGTSFATFHPHLRELAMIVGLASQKFLSYPVLHFFHSPSRATALEPSLVALDEALLVLEHGVAEEARPPTVLLRPLRASLNRFAEVVSPAFVLAAQQPPAPPSLQPLREAGVPTADHEDFRRRVDDMADHRRVMLALLRDAQWDWETAVEAHAGRQR